MDYSSSKYVGANNGPESKANQEKASLLSWSELPPPVIENILSFLNRHDQCSMSFACKNYLNQFSSPSLWRTMKFCLPEVDYNMEIYPEVHFARKYGRMFLHLEIICNRIRSDLLEVIWKQLKLFLQAVSCHSQLFSIKFINMATYFKRLDYVIYEDIYQTIVNFLATQKKLKLVEFRNTQFKYFEAAELLKVICINNSKTLKQFILEDFVNETTNFNPRNNVICERFNFENLQVLTADYSEILENIIMSFYYYRQPYLQRSKETLKKLKIVCDGSKKVNYSGVRPEIWRCIIKKYPDLKIDLIYSCKSQVRNPANVFIVRNMPVRSLCFQWEKSVRASLEIGSLFRHLITCIINEFIEELNVLWLHKSPNLASDLINFVNVSPRLKILNIYIQHPVEKLDVVLNTWLENKPVSLEYVHLTIKNVPTPEGANIYAALQDYYAPLLKQLGLNLSLVDESTWRTLRNGKVYNVQNA